MLWVIMLSRMLSVLMLCVIMLSRIMLSVIMLRFFMLNVVASQKGLFTCPILQTDIILTGIILLKSNLLK
jgi:hypothetical protein